MPDKSIRILYIEDDPEMIDLVEMILKRRDYVMVGAQGGREGLDAARNNPPDIILLDLMMPDLDGWEVYHQIKSDGNLQATPVIIITAKAQSIDRVLGLEVAKVDDYLAKPFHPSDLLASIDRLLARKSDLAKA